MSIMQISAPKKKRTPRPVQLGRIRETPRVVASPQDGKVPRLAQAAIARTLHVSSDEKSIHLCSELRAARERFQES